MLTDRDVPPSIPTWGGRHRPLCWPRPTSAFRSGLEYPFMLVDVSHVIEHGMITYRGLPAPLVCDFLSREQSRALYAAGTEFHIGKIEMVANTGTYLNAPFHRYAGGKDISELPLERLANLPGVVIAADVAR